MERIIPAVIPYTQHDVLEALSRYEFAPMVQVDLVDGAFAAPASWPYRKNDNVTFDSPLPSQPAIELDLMVTDPLSAANAWREHGVQRFVLHADAFENAAALADTIATLKESAEGTTVGVALLNNTPLSLVDEVRSEIDFVQCMGIATIGAQGQPFDERVLARIAHLKARHPKLPLTVDGGVNLETLPKLAAAGANHFVVGSALANTPDPERSYRQLTRIAADV